MKIISKEIFTTQLGDTILSVYEITSKSNYVGIIYAASHSKIGVYDIDGNGDPKFTVEGGEIATNVTVISEIKIPELKQLRNIIDSNLKTELLPDEEE